MNKRMKMTLMIAAVAAIALLMTGCFNTVQPAPTQNPTTQPTATATTAPTATDVPVPSDLPTTSSDIVDTTEVPGATGGLEVAPSPSASTAP